MSISDAPAAIACLHSSILIFKKVCDDGNPAPTDAKPSSETVRLLFTQSTILG